MQPNNTILLHETEVFMRGELDNVTVANSSILLDMVQGAYVPYGCYTTPALSLPLFDALRASWNADTPPGTAVEVQLRVLVDGNWSAWCTMGRWSPHLARTGAAETRRGPLHLTADQLALESKAAAQAQLRIYLYTREEKATPAVHLLAISARPLDHIPGGGRAVTNHLRLIPYVAARRAPALQPVMDLACCLASLTNRWGADLLPEELALSMRDHLNGQNLSFAAAAVSCWGFPAWVCWADLGDLRAELRAGYGAVVALESTPAQQSAGLPAVHYAALRGFTADAVLLMDPWAGSDDFAAETSLPLDTFLVAWNNVALFMRPRTRPESGCPPRTPVVLRPLPDAAPGIYGLYAGGELRTLPDGFVADTAMGAGVLAWSVPDVRPHATTAHRTFHFVQPEAGGIRLGGADAPAPPGAIRLEESADAPAAGPLRYTVYAIEANGAMMVGDITL